MNQPGALSLLPIAVTLVTALASRNVLAGLAVGLFVGVLMITGDGPLDAAVLLVTDHLVPQLMDDYNAAVLVLLVFIGGFVALMEQSGGGAAFARDVTRWLTNRLRLQLAAWSGGILIFFSDLGTPLIVGPVFRSLADRLGLSRQKLAFIIDSTASPVAILIPFIGWGVYIMSLLNQQFSLLGIAESDYDAFVRAVPFQFYAWLAVLMTPWLALLRTDYGAMAVVEKDAAGRTPAVGLDEPGTAVEMGAEEEVSGRAYFIWLPLLVLGGVLCWMLVPLGFPFGRISGGDFRAALSVAYLCAALTLLLVMTLAGSRRLLANVGIYFEGMSRMMQVAIMLVLAWALSDVGEMLGTADYIAGVAAAGVPGWVIPLMAFLFSAVVSFATGSSWGTFAIMFPLALPAALATEAPLYVVIGAVLSGGLFGDHSSPISETTILSATGAGCDQYAHFRTQVPYALTNGCLAGLGFLVAGITGTWWVLAAVLMLQALTLVSIRAMNGDRSRLVIS
jgi:Na+/H+ antiporter NhaC